GGASVAGWRQEAPPSARSAAGAGQGLGTDLWLGSIGLFCLGSVMNAINFITTTLRDRAAGMTFMRMPLTAWAWFVTAILSLLAFSVLLAALIMLLCDRNAGTGFFVPSGLIVSGKPVDHSGVSPLLWQHLFWFFGHP